MVRLSVEISDRVASDFEGKLRAAQSLGIHNIEIKDIIDGERLDRMSGEAVELIRDLLIDYNMRVVLISTGIDPQDREALKLLFRKALTLDAEAVKLDVKAGDDTAFVRRMAQSFGIKLYVENRADGPFPDETALLAAAREGMRIIFNPLEIVKTERHPFFHAYYASRIKNDIGFLRICDGLYRTHEAVPLGHGCAEVKELTSIIQCRTYEGYFSFIPYMPDMDLDAYRTCVETFKGLLKRL